MDADFAVELGKDDEVLEVPWAALDGGPCYLDLKREPNLLLKLEEAQRFPALAEFLKAVNDPASVFETAKCDVWSTTEISSEEEIYGLAWKFGSYVDLLFSECSRRRDFQHYEWTAKKLCELLKKVPDIPASAEFLIRRCFFHTDAGMQEGFYITLYLFGFGKDEAQAQQQWMISLKLAENAMRQLTRSESM